MRVEYVNHASLLLETKSARLLTDPFFFLDDDERSLVCFYPPRELSPGDLGKIDYVYSSHEHPDHCHFPTLKRMKGEIGQVLLPAARPALSRVYRDLGFRNVRLLQNRATVVLKGGVEVTPFWDDALDTVLVAKIGDRLVLHGNDCHLRPQTLTEIRRRFGTIDYAFTLFTDVQDLFPLLLPRSSKELLKLARLRERQGLRYRLDCLRRLRPRVIIPYSYTIAYHGKEQLYLNGVGRLLPRAFRDAVATEVKSAACWLLQPGDSIDTATDAISRASDVDYWGSTLPQFMRNFARYVRANRSKLPRFDPGDPDRIHPACLRLLQQRMKNPFPASLPVQCLRLRIFGAGRERTYDLDFRARTVKAGQKNGAPCDLEISMPAKFMSWMLNRKYDVFFLLYTYMVKFRVGRRLKMGPLKEFEFLIDCMLAIFEDREGAWPGVGSEAMTYSNVDLSA